MNTPTSTAQQWAAQELATAKLGDARLTKRLFRIVADKLANPTASIPHASRDWAASKAAYRFFASKKVAAEAIGAAHAHATVQRVLLQPTVLVLQDTTELNYSAHPNTTGLGPIDNPLCSGLKIHSGLAVTTEGVPLGLLHQAVWTRDIPATEKKPRKRPPQVERESQQRALTMRFALVTFVAYIRWKLPSMQAQARMHNLVLMFCNARYRSSEVAASRALPLITTPETSLRSSGVFRLS